MMRAKAGKASPAAKWPRWTKKREDIFFGELAEVCNVAAAARAAGFPDAKSAYTRKKRDPDFRAAWEEAVAEGYGRLELEMLERARFGENRPADLGKSGREAAGDPHRAGLSLLKHPPEPGAGTGAGGAAADARPKLRDEIEAQARRDRPAARRPGLKRRGARRPVTEPSLRPPFDVERLALLPAAERRRCSAPTGGRPSWPNSSPAGACGPGPASFRRRAAWRVWLMMAGRGYGKTRAGAEWVHHLAEEEGLRIAIVGPTEDEARRVMIEGAWSRWRWSIWKSPGGRASSSKASTCRDTSWCAARRSAAPGSRAGAPHCTTAI